MAYEEKPHIHAAAHMDVDIVFCVDATRTMGDALQGGCPLIDDWKQWARITYEAFSKEMHQQYRMFRNLCIRLILFRDYLADGKHAMMTTDFFRLPQQAAEFEACVNSIYADGGGDLPEDGLEALAYAMRSQWPSAAAPRKRQVIVVLTDADAHPLGFGKKAEFYPAGMPENMEELADWWENPAVIHQVGKRLILLAPDEGNWKYISDNWDYTWHIPTVAGNGLSEQRCSDILSLIVRAL